MPGPRSNEFYREVSPEEQLVERWAGALGKRIGDILSEELVRAWHRAWAPGTRPPALAGARAAMLAHLGSAWGEVGTCIDALDRKALEDATAPEAARAAPSGPLPPHIAVLPPSMRTFYYLQTIPEAELAAVFTGVSKWLARHAHPADAEVAARGDAEVGGDLARAAAAMYGEWVAMEQPA